jgi:hypothetical protein
VLSTTLSVVPALSELHIKYWDEPKDDETPQVYRQQRRELAAVWAQNNWLLRDVTFPDGVCFRFGCSGGRRPFSARS